MSPTVSSSQTHSVGCEDVADDPAVAPGANDLGGAQIPEGLGGGGALLCAVRGPVAAS